MAALPEKQRDLWTTGYFLYNVALQRAMKHLAGVIDVAGKEERSQCEKGQPVDGFFPRIL